MRAAGEGVPLSHRTRYRWVAPDGTRGPWRATMFLAARHAVNTVHGGRRGGVTVRFTGLAASQLFYGQLVQQGWTLEAGGLR